MRPHAEARRLLEREKDGHPGIVSFQLAHAAESGLNVVDDRRRQPPAQVSLDSPLPSRIYLKKIDQDTAIPRSLPRGEPLRRLHVLAACQDHLLERLQPLFHAAFVALRRETPLLNLSQLGPAALQCLVGLLHTGPQLLLAFPQHPRLGRGRLHLVRRLAQRRLDAGQPLRQVSLARLEALRSLGHGRPALIRPGERARHFLLAGLLLLHGRPGLPQRGVELPPLVLQ